jgi:hypothetical protein
MLRRWERLEADIGFDIADPTGAAGVWTFGGGGRAGFTVGGGSVIKGSEDVVMAALKVGEVATREALGMTEDIIDEAGTKSGGAGPFLQAHESDKSFEGIRGKGRGIWSGFAGVSKKKNPPCIF